MEASEQTTFLGDPGEADGPRPPGPADGPIFHRNELVAERFQIVRFLGQGGLGQVYEAQDLELGQRVALKTIRPEVAESRRARERFRREVLHARRVTHPNVCRLFDLYHHRPGADADADAGAGAGGPVRGRLLLSMELLPGSTLAERLRRRGPLPAVEAWPLIRQLASALDASHRAGVVHGDLKSGNVILVPDGGEIRAVVTDFGLSRSVEELAVEGGAAGSVAAPVAATLVAGTPVAGTPAYMAPEQLRGEPPTPASDLYALAVVIHEVRTGHLPEGVGLVSAARGPRTPKVGRRWRRVLRRALASRPEARFRSAGELVAALAPEGGAATSRRRRILAGTLAATAVAAAVSVALPRLTPSPSPEMVLQIEREIEDVDVPGPGLPAVRHPVAARLLAEARAAARCAEPHRAAVLLAEAVALEPASPTLHAELFRVWTALGDRVLAAEAAERADALAAGLTAEQRLPLRAARHQAAGEWREAIEIYTALRTFEPEEIDRWLDLARAQLGAHDPAAALETLERLRRAGLGVDEDPRLELLELRVLGKVEERERLEAAVRRVAALGERDGNPRLLGWAAYSQGLLAARDGRRQEALAALDGAAEHFRRADDGLGLARALTRAAFERRFTEPALAERQARRSLELFRRLGDPAGEGAALNSLALMVRPRDQRRAEELHRRALDLAHAAGDDRSRSAHLNNLVLILRYEGRIREAEAMLEEALELARATGSERFEAMVRVNRGVVRARLAELSGAREDLEAALEVLRRLEDGEVAFPLAELARLRLVAGETDAAAELAAELRRRLATIENPWADAELLRLESELAHHRGELEAARRRGEEARAAGVALHWEEWLPGLRLHLARLALDEGRPGDVEAEVRELAGNGDPAKLRPVDRVRAAQLLARALAEQGRPAAARAALAGVAAELARVEERRVLLEQTIAVARLDLAENKPESAAGALAGVVDEAGRLGLETVRREASSLLGAAELAASRTAPERRRAEIPVPAAVPLQGGGSVPWGPP